MHYFFDSIHELRKITIKSSVWESTVQLQTISYLENKYADKQCIDVQAILRKIVEKISNGESLDELKLDVPGIGQGCAVRDSLLFLQKLRSWESRIMRFALYELLSDNDSDTYGLQIVLALMCRGAKECNARRNSAFHTILIRVHCGLKSVHNCDDKIQLLKEIVLEFLNDTKERAFKSTFIEPSLFYFRSQNDQTNEGDVEVHGINVYLTVIEVTTGVRLNRLAMYDDDSMTGSVAFLYDRIFFNSINTLWLPDNIGKSFESFRCCQTQMKKNVALPTGFIFPHCRTPGAIARAIQDLSPCNHRYLKQLVPYVRQFMTYFQPQIFLPRLINYLISDPVSHAYLSNLFNIYRNNLVDNTNDMENSIEYWIWDLEAFPAVLRLDRVKKLLSLLDVFEDEEISTSTSEELQNKVDRNNITLTHRQLSYIKTTEPKEVVLPSDLENRLIGVRIVVLATYAGRGYLLTVTDLGPSQLTITQVSWLIDQQFILLELLNDEGSNQNINVVAVSCRSFPDKLLAYDSYGFVAMIDTEKYTTQSLNTDQKFHILWQLQKTDSDGFALASVEFYPTRRLNLCQNGSLIMSEDMGAFSRWSIANVEQDFDTRVSANLYIRFRDKIVRFRAYTSASRDSSNDTKYYLTSGQSGEVAVQKSETDTTALQRQEEDGSLWRIIATGLDTSVVISNESYPGKNLQCDPYTGVIGTCGNRLSWEHWHFEEHAFSSSSDIETIVYLCSDSADDYPSGVSRCLQPCSDGKTLTGAVDRSSFALWIVELID